MLLGARQECIAGGADIQEKMAILKSFGYDFLELSLSRAEIANLGPQSANIYKSAVKQSGLAIRSTSLGHFGGFAALPADERAVILRHIRAFVDFTAAIGADTILLATHEERGSVDAYADVYAQALRPIADVAAAAGVTLALEHVGWYKPYQLTELVQTISHPAIRIYFDMGKCLYVGENPLEQARICAPFNQSKRLRDSNAICG